MVDTNFFGNFDLASASIWLFWLFFALLIYYLQTENMREGYPMTDDDGAPAPNQGPFPVPKDKTFHLRDGRGDLTVPSGQRGDRDSLAMERTGVAAGSPYIPTGDPMVDGIGAASWAPRRDIPELDAHGQAKIMPIGNCEGFEVSAGTDPRGLAVVSGDGEVVGRCVDMWIDPTEAMVRYLVMDQNPEGTGKHRMIPMNFARIKSDRVVVRSLYEKHFGGVPGIKSKDQITLLEEEKIMAYYGGGTLYADEKRNEPLI